jgi:hypothetical protein
LIAETKAMTHDAASIGNEGDPLSPPVHESTLPKFYRVLLHNGEGLSWVPNWLEKEALAER